MWAVFKTYGLAWTVQFFADLVRIGIKFTAPLLIKAFLIELEQEEPSTTKRLTLGLALVLSTVVVNFVTSIVGIEKERLKIRLSGALSLLIYEKELTVSSAGRESDHSIYQTTGVDVNNLVKVSVVIISRFYLLC